MEINTNNMGGVAISVAYVKDHLSAATGLACIENSVKLTSTSVLLAGSVAKQIVGAIALLLSQQGHFDLHMAIDGYVDGLQLRGIIFSQLLNHTSGIRETDSLFSLAGMREYDYININDHLRATNYQVTPLFQPGSNFSYGNINYILAAHLLEKVCKKSLAEIADDVIFQPFHLTKSLFQDSPDMIIQSRSSSYRNVGARLARADRPVSLPGPSGLWSTVEDLTTWAQVRASIFKAAPAINLSASDAGALAGWDCPLSGSYKAGIIELTNPGEEVLLHPGDEQGFSSQVCSINDELHIVVMSNQQELRAADLARSFIANMMKKFKKQKTLKAIQIHIEDFITNIKNGSDFFWTDTLAKPTKNQPPTSIPSDWCGTYSCSEAMAPIHIVNSEEGPVLWRGAARDVLTFRDNNRWAGPGYQIRLVNQEKIAIEMKLRRAGTLQFQLV